MKREIRHIVLAAIIGALVCLCSCDNNVLLLVNPMVGTDGHGHTTPAAIVPFGMVQPGPDTRLDGWDGCSGYHYTDDTVYGFSQTHLSGTGCLDYGDVLLTPFTTENLESLSEIPWGDSLRICYLSTFSHRNEKASPGYYKTILQRNRTKVELTCNERCAFHKYTYPTTGVKGFVVDLRHRDKTISAGLRLTQEDIAYREGDGVAKVESPTLTGWRESSSWNPDQKLFFALRCNVPIDSIALSPDSTQALVFVSEDTKDVEIAISISSVDEAGATLNLNEYGIYDFQSAKEGAEFVWRQELKKIEIQGGTRTERKNFYTALYHCMTAPYLYSDVDGRYRGMDDKIHHTNPEHPRYTVFSLWDTYRALNPLLALIDRKRTEDFVKTMLGQYQEGGELTMWELWGDETHCMIGYHAVPVILDAYRAGILDEWIEEAGRLNQDSPVAQLLDAMIATSNRTDAHKAYGRNGYLDASLDNESVSKTLEYAYDDWCIAEFARLLSQNCDSTNDYAILHFGDSTQVLFYKDIISTYSQRAQSWKNIMDGNGFMHARKNGGFVTPFDPTEVNNHYTEANCWQYSSYVPQDVKGWISAIGGEASAEAFLDSLFEGSSVMTGRNQSDITGLIGQYSHGNEPSHHAAYLYCYLGKPEKTQTYVDKILTTLYTPHPDGLCGNEDCGQMSAWYVLSACGLYPVCPGSGEFVTVSPQFNHITIHRYYPNGEDFPLVINKNSWKCGRFFVPGNLQKEQRDKKYKESPMSIQKHKELTPLPYFGNWEQRFDGSTQIKLACPDPSAEIYYTTDGSTPSRDNATRYTGPFTIEGDALIMAVAYKPSTGYSKPISQHLTLFSADKKLTYLTQPAQQYYENGPEGLVDRIYGTENYRIGGWQGWQQDMKVKIDLLEEKEISWIGVDCLENMKSWIFFPKEIQIEYSNNDTTYAELGSVKNEEFPAIKQRESDCVTHTFALSKTVSCRYLIVTARNYGAIPNWHVSSGEQAWLFVDEIEIK